jgi:hypothetical protein
MGKLRDDVVRKGSPGRIPAVSGFADARLPILPNI